MNLFPVRVTAIALFAFSTAAADGSYSVIARFHTGGEGGYDYLRADPDARRLYVTRGTRVDVLDSDSGKKVGEVTGLKRAHGVALATEAGHGFATSSGDDQITVFDLKSLAVLKRVPATGKSPDAIEYDPDTKRVYAADHGSGDVTVLDGATGEVVGTVKFGEGQLEALAFDGRGNGFVNAEDKSAVFVFDLKTLTPKARWSSAPGEGGTGLVADTAHHRVISACANGKLVVFDSDTGTIVATPAIDDDPDGLAFEPKTGRLFVPCVGGTLNILQEQSPDTYTTLQTVTTQPGCRTIALDERTGHVFTAAPKFGPRPAATPDGKRPRPTAVPDSFDVLVVGQK